MHNPNSKQREPQSIGSALGLFMPQVQKRSAIKTDQEPDESKGPIYLHPKITPRDFAQTMTNYRQFVARYNEEVELKNQEVKEYNAEVSQYCREHTKSDFQKFEEFQWVKKNKKAHAPSVYNALVEKYNAKHGLCLRKMNLLNKVKPPVERTFNAMLRMFGGQLGSAPKPKDGLEFYYRGPLRKYLYYPNKVIEVQQDDVDVLPITRKTATEHRKRLEEAGIFIDYAYHGPTRAVSLRFNPEVISVTDEYSRKVSGTRVFKKSDLPQNQTVGESQKKKVPHNNDSTRSQKSKKELKQRLGVSAIAQTTQLPAAGSTGSPEKQDAKNSNTSGGENHKKIEKNSPGRAENSEKDQKSTGLDQNHSTGTENSTGVLPEVSSQLQDHLKPDQEFCESLHVRQKIKQVDQNLLYLESKQGILTQSEFIALLAQQFMGYALPIFEGQKNTALGSWFEAYRTLQDSRFKTFTGRQFTKQESYATWLNMMGAMRQVLHFKNRHKTWVPAYPNLYFDPSRREKILNCFGYFEERYKTTPSAQQRAEKRKARAANDKKRMADIDKAKHKVFAFVKGKLQLEELQNYVMKNCDKSVYNRLPDLIQDEHKRLFPEEYK